MREVLFRLQVRDWHFGPIKKRLEGVISGIVHLQRDSFPDDDTWGRFERLIQATTMLPNRTSGEGTIQATTSQMSDEQADEWLEEAFSIFIALEEAFGRLGMSSVNG